MKVEPTFNPFFCAISVLIMTSSAEPVPEIAWPLTIVSVDAPMLTAAVGSVEPAK